MTYDEAEAIAHGCTHPEKRMNVGTRTERVDLCFECASAYSKARKQARKDELKAWKEANLPTCQRCGKPHSARWRLWSWCLCGRCKTETSKEHIKNTNGNIVLGMSGPCVNTKNWDNPNEFIQGYW